MNIDREEALRRLRSPNNLANSLVENPSASPKTNHREVVKPSRGTEVPGSVRDEVARIALMGQVPQKVIAREFGLTQPTVSQYKHGKVGGVAPTEERRLEHQKRVDDIKDTALLKLMGALGVITPEKLNDLEVKDAARVAKDMAAVYNSLGPKDTGAGPSVNVVVYSPEIRKESQFKVIEV